MLGKRLAHYEITGSIGKGGMGEVYRARDSKLGRDVAIKVLPVEMSGDPERLARFEREARTLATLQHPNIASVYGFESVDNVRFLVMELVDGEDLSQHLQRGPLPVDEVVDLGVQLAEGLAAAHAVGVTHRDLKPANIKVSPEGKLKILDFGLARINMDEQGSGTDLQHSPTLTGMTQAGVILGTAAYMSPEQARGRRADHRADIWAYGVVLFEMLTGRRLFEGETVSDTLAGVLRAEVPWDQLPHDTAPTLRRIITRCLDRDASRRLQSIAEARIALEDLKAGRTGESAVQPVAKGDSRWRRERLLWMFAALVLAAVVVTMAFRRTDVPAQPLVQSTLMPPAGWDFAPGSPFAVSPDGSQIAYVAVARPGNESAAAGSNAIWICDLALPEPRRLADTDRDGFPFWSPDGRWLGFFANGKLNKIEAKGGPVIPLCDATDGRGATWNAAGIILFQRAWSEGLMKVSASGGTAEPLTTLEKERFDVAHRWPHFLPDGKHFLFYLVSTTNANSEFSGIYLGSLDSKELRFLRKTESRAIYARGYLLYRAGSTLMAHPFDVSKFQFTGDPIPLSADVPGGAVSWGGAEFGTSEAGVLAHLLGAGAASTVMQWRDRDGKVLKILSDPATQTEPRLSHDGTRIAVAVGHDAGDIWIYDLGRGMRTRFTGDPADERTPVWSPDDSRLAFVSSRGDKGEIYVGLASGQSEPKLLFTAGEPVELTDWSNDGRLIFFNRVNPKGSDIWTLDVEKAAAARLLSGNWFEGARLSPDGKWLAFTSYESGKGEIYVQAFPAAGGRWIVSSDAVPGRAGHPVWRADGRELFYQRGSAIAAVPVSGDGGFSSGAPKVLFGISVTAVSADYAVSADGLRILTNELPPADPSKIGARLILNWPRALTAH